MPPTTRRVGSRTPLIALAVLVVGHVALIVSRNYRPGGDWAFIELRTSDVLSADTPLTGAWSRYGWNHPGPFLYDALAFPHLVTGGSWRGLWMGAMLLNLVAIGVTWWLAAARSAGWAAVSVTAAVWTIAAATPHLFTDPWNASVVVLALLPVAAGTVASRAGDRRGVAVVLVTFVAVAQTHVAYAVLLAPSVALVVAIGARRWLRWTGVWVGAGAALCLPILVDTLVNWPGNLWRSVRFTATSDEPTVGLGQVARVVGHASSLEFFSDPGLPSFAAVVGDTPWGTAPFLVWWISAGAWWLARRRGWTLWRLALETTALLWLGGALMTWRTRGPLLVWLTTWTVLVAALSWSLVLAVAIRWLAERRTAPVDAGRGAPGSHAVVADTTGFGSLGAGVRSSDATPRHAVPADTAGSDASGSRASRPDATAPVSATVDGTVAAGTTVDGTVVDDTVVDDAAAAGTVADDAAAAGTVADGTAADGTTAVDDRPTRAAAVDRLASGWLVVVGTLASAVLAMVNVVGSVGIGYPFQEFTPVVEQFATAARDEVDVPTLVDLAGPEYEAGAVQSALIAELEDEGGRPLGRPDQRLQLGSHRVAPSLDGRRLLVQVEPRTFPPAGARELAVSDPLTPDERAEADRLVDELTTLLLSAGLDSRVALLSNEQAPLAAFDAPDAVTARRAEFERLGALHARGPRIVLYVMDADPPPAD